MLKIVVIMFVLYFVLIAYADSFGSDDLHSSKDCHIVKSHVCSCSAGLQIKFFFFLPAGLPVRELVALYKNKIIILFKLLLLERRVIICVICVLTFIAIFVKIINVTSFEFAE